MKKILIVDDSKMLRDDLKKIIEMVGGLQLVGEAEDALQAISIIENLKPDIVLLDLNLNMGNGIDVLGALYKAKNKPVTIVLTNYTNKAFRKTSVELGAEYFYDKTHDLDRLINTLKQLAAKTD